MVNVVYSWKKPIEQHLFNRLFYHIICAALVSLLSAAVICSTAAAAVPQIKPPVLQPGDCIAIAAPASGMDDMDITAAVHKLKSWGYKVKYAPHLYMQSGYLAGTDEMRAADLNALFGDDEVDAILCLRGGYGSARILDMIDYDAIAAHPKLLIGYSDITALQAALMQKANLVVIHGPMAIDINDDGYNYTDYQLQCGLNHTAVSDTGEFALPQNHQLEVLREGSARGRLIGGNLAVIASLCGTSYELKADDGDYILFLEEVGEDSYVIDRYLNQLWQNGLLRRVKAIVVGTLRRCEPIDAQPFDYSVRQVFEHYAALAQVPVLYNFPAGHGAVNGFLPLNVEVEVQADKKDSKLIYLESYAR